MAALNKRIKFPSYIILTLDNDLGDFLRYEKEGATGLFGDLLKWLVEVMNDAIAKRKKNLPVKTLKSRETFYWVMSPSHRNFSAVEQIERRKFNDALVSLLKLQSNMRSIFLKNFWSPDSDDFVGRVNGKITDAGQTV